MACDLRDTARTAAVVRGLSPDVVIHAQAMSDVDRCELDPQAAWEQNVRTLEHVVTALDARRTWLVGIGSDYVFDGKKGSPYDEADAPNPLGVYGRAKLAAEQATLRFPRSVVVRTSTLFGAGRMNFCDHIVAQVTAGQPVDAFTDQVTSPTSTEDLAEALAELAEALGRIGDGPVPRLLHITNAGSASRVAFAERVADLLQAPRGLIRRIRMADQHRPAPRPACTAMASRHLQSILGRTLRPWDEAVQAYLRQRRWLN